MKKITEVRNEYTDDQNYTHIDAWYDNDDNSEGKTIAIVCRDTGKVYWIDNRERLNEMARQAIAEVKKQMEMGNVVEAEISPMHSIRQEVSDLAFREGWDIFYTYRADNTQNRFELQRMDEENVFDSDRDAAIHVVTEAISNPQGLHAEALLFLAKHSPEEASVRIRQFVGEKRFKKLKQVMRHTEFDNFK